MPVRGATTYENVGAAFRAAMVAWSGQVAAEDSASHIHQAIFIEADRSRCLRWILPTAIESCWSLTPEAAGPEKDEPGYRENRFLCWRPCQKTA